MNMSAYYEPNIDDLKIPIQGKIVKIFDTKERNGYKSREFWLEHESTPLDDGTTRKSVLRFELGNKVDAKFDNTASIDKFGVGTVVKFVFRLGGSVWNGNPAQGKGPACFVRLTPISRFEVVGKASAPSPSYGSRPVPAPAKPSANETVSYDDVSDDMPF